LLGNFFPTRTESAKNSQLERQHRKKFLSSQGVERVRESEEVSEFLHHLSQDTANEINLNFFSCLSLLILLATAGGKCEEMGNIIFTTWKIPSSTDHDWK
jgi:hypothetical protein